MLGSPGGSKPQRMGAGRFAGLDPRAVEPTCTAVRREALSPGTSIQFEADIRTEVGGA